MVRWLLTLIIEVGASFTSQASTLTLVRLVLGSLSTFENRQILKISSNDIHHVQL